MHALKIFDLSNASKRDNYIELAQSEYEQVQKIQGSKNVIKYTDFNTDSIQIEGNNYTPVAYIAMEPINGGDFFEWVAFTGDAFPERIVRYFFL